MTTSTFMQATRGTKSDKPRNADDFYPSPPDAIRALLSPKGDGERIRRLGAVWEPACGDGAMVREIRAAGLVCHATDYVSRGCPQPFSRVDYFHFQSSPGAAIVTNPPYNLANGAGKLRWVRHAMGTTGWRYMALLLNAEWERSGEARRFLEVHPYSYQWQLGWRIDWTGQKRPSTWHSWYVWDRESPYSMNVRFLERLVK